MRNNTSQNSPLTGWEMRLSATKGPDKRDVIQDVINAGDLPELPNDVVGFFPSNIAHAFQVLPVKREHDTGLVVLVARYPLDTDTVETLQFWCGTDEFRIADPAEKEFEPFRQNFEVVLKAHYHLLQHNHLSGECCPDLEGKGS